MIELWTCPKCGETLSFSERCARCPAGHCYDIAKEGYVNLLLSTGGIHGDSREMVEARRRFLGSGAYEPLRLAVDLVTDLFSPMATEEFYRVLKPHGILLLAIPEREHLFGLKRILYDTPYKNEVADTALPGFSLLESTELRYPLTVVGREQISDLFYMTPYAYRTSPKDKEKLAGCDTLETDAHFRLLIYQKGDCQETHDVL